MSELSRVMEETILNMKDPVEMAEVGKVLSVGDGIARIHGLNNIQAGEMVEFKAGIKVRVRARVSLRPSAVVM